MGIQRRDGSIQSANVPAYNNLAKPKIDKDFGIYRGIVIATHFIDDQLNLTFENVQVTYEVMILGGYLEGQILQNVKSMNAYGGENNYAERIWRPCESSDVTGKKLNELKGDIVYVGFLQGSNRAPVIIGGGVQPNDISETGATKADGFRDIKEYNGVYTEINNKGEFQILRKGGKVDANTGVLTPSDSWEAKLQMSMNQIFLGDSSSNIVFNKSAKTLTTTVGAVSETIDGSSKKITQTVGSVTVTIDGAANKVTIVAGGATLNIDGGSGKISLASGLVDLGQSVSDFATLFTELSTAFSTHFHMAPQAPAGVLPTTPPVAPLLPTVGSQTVKVAP